MTELNRLLRYFGPIVAGFIITKFALPADLQGPLTELIVVGGGYAVSYVASIARDKAKD